MFHIRKKLYYYYELNFDGNDFKTIMILCSEKLGTIFTYETTSPFNYKSYLRHIQTSCPKIIFKIIQYFNAATEINYRSLPFKILEKMRRLLRYYLGSIHVKGKKKCFLIRTQLFFLLWNTLVLVVKQTNFQSPRRSSALSQETKLRLWRPVNRIIAT